VIELINQAKIFRFVNKPIQVRHLRNHVEAALEKYRAFRHRPDLVRGQKPAESLQAKTSIWGARLYEAIRSLPERLLARP
jgi:DNA-binding NtrC family response regulator